MRPDPRVQPAMRACGLKFVLAALAASSAAAQVDPREIVRRSVETHDQSSQLARNYTYQVRRLEREFDGKGQVTSTRNRVMEVLFVGGKPYRHLVEKDGHPLSPDEARREQEKLDKVVAEASRLSPSERDARLAEYEKKRVKEREPLREIPDAFDFKLLREETLDSHPVYVIDVQPRAGYRGKNHDLFSKMRGTLWIDQTSYNWVKVEAETLSTISFGLFVARLEKGTRIQFEQTRVNDEIWLPKRAAFTASARLALLKKLNLNEEVTFSNYRKFQSVSTIVFSSDAPGSR